MLWTPQAEFQASVSNDATRPTGARGTSLIPGPSNVKNASWTELLDAALLTFDAYGILININANAASANARDSLYDIGVDPADSSTFTVLIANLLGSCAAAFSATSIAGGHWYYFPLFIAAGSQLGVRASVNNASNITSGVYVKLFGKPKYPVRAGRFVTTFGATTASSSGTSITSGEAAEGAWTDLSGANTTTPLWWWQAGFGINDGTMNDLTYTIDLSVGDGTNKHIVSDDQFIVTTALERASVWPNLGGGAFECAAGVRPYGRLQCSGTPDASLSMCAYGVGG